MEKIYQAYYTKSNEILRFMISRLHLRPGLQILEPCGGDGVFVDGILSVGKDVEIDVYELNPDAVHILQEKYDEYKQVRVCQADTLTDPNLLLKMNMGGQYDCVIANPPYGAWQGYDRRRDLKDVYEGLYVRETYGLFLYQGLRLLKPGGRLVFIVPDTYLNLHMHKALRRVLLTEACIEEIAIFPSSFFPGVNFGYANLSIITMRRAVPADVVGDNRVVVTWGYEDVRQLESQDASVKRMIVRQKQVLESMDHALFLSTPTGHSALIGNTSLRIGDIAACVTGIYTGNDKVYLRVLSPEVKNGRKYQQISPEGVWSGGRPSLRGIEGSRCFVPVVKGGGVRFVKPDRWFIDWSVNAVQHYRVDKKARLQNSEYYFQHGIAVPMVSSTHVTASLIEERVFDQSIVGVFPREDRYFYYLLGFFNTEVCTRLLRTINPSANNSANYIKKLPFIEPSDMELMQVDALVRRIVDGVRNTGATSAADLRQLNLTFDCIYSAGKVNIASPTTEVPIRTIGLKTRGRSRKRVIGDSSLPQLFE